ncbi:hypothetical protein ABID26_006524 [Mesorhizobium shonense]|uniref:Uncharacterized protein n=1 Tax=Mesorhizobium shonense TaxID=1209948 RepID=A0ABV2I2F1_9HYPH|nr:hypothetical protein [Mesorhizobium sp.]TIS49161.1 MAG: hypothetical protein E5W96_15595 [Mesorhizobium sp.]
MFRRHRNTSYPTKFGSTAALFPFHAPAAEQLQVRFMRETDSEVIDALAKELFYKANSTGAWGTADEAVRVYFRKEAARKLQQKATRENS